MEAQLTLFPPDMMRQVEEKQLLAYVQRLEQTIEKHKRSISSLQGHFTKKKNKHKYKN